jgi:hypothetical protein
MSEARRRFLRAIAERLPPERVAEIHLFQPLRQAGQESGLAVIAAAPEDATRSAPDAPVERDGAADGGASGGRLPSHGRLTIYRASYRLTLKGGERGRWEVDVIAEADAPLAAVDDVVRGVQRRAGDDCLPERLTADELRAALAEEPWTAAR